MTDRHRPAIDERTYQRRRLGVLAGLLALVLAAAPLLGGAGDGTVTVAAADQPIRAAAIGSPTAVRELLSETTTTLVEATGASTTTTTTPATTTTAAPAAEVAAAAAAEPTTTTTTAAPARSEGYAYDDPRSTQVWYDLADCESGGNWSIDTGNGYYGGLQFSLPTWESVGGTGYPHEHPAATQIELGRRLQARQGWGAWPHCSEKLGLR